MQQVGVDVISPDKELAPKADGRDPAVSREGQTNLYLIIKGEVFPWFGPFFCPSYVCFVRR
jgi:hypothetical protein